MAGITRRHLFVAALIVGAVGGLAGGVATYWSVVRIVPPIVASVVIESVGKATRVERHDQPAVEKQASAAVPAR